MRNQTGRQSQILWRSSEAAVVTGGVSTADWMATGVCVNADDIRPGDLFVASEGEDLNRAMAKGAVAAVVSHVPDDFVCDMPLLKVASTYDALRDLARAARFRSHAAVIAVQGRHARTIAGQALQSIGHTQECGRILSIGMANLPEDYDFGVFPLAPSVRPDIAIISDVTGGFQDGLFEGMPPNATVILNRDCPGFSQVAAKARTIGLKHIYSYGTHPESTARIVETLESANGTRLSVNVMGEEVSTIVQLKADKAGSAAAILLAVRLCGQNMQSAAQAWSLTLSLKKKIAGHSLSLFDAMPKVKEALGRQAVFRVQNLIDLGLGRQTAILDNISFAEDGGAVLHKNDLAIPAKMDKLNFVYTCKGFVSVPNAHSALKGIHGKIRLEQIVPDVLAPGDFVVFSQTGQNRNLNLIEALRLKSGWRKRERRDSEHAV